MAIRVLTRAEVEIAVDWAAQEGWNPGLRDAEAFYAADPEGFLGVERDGRVIGTISAVRYEEHYGFIGLYIMARPFRVSLDGVRLGQAGLARLEGRCVGVDGVLDKAAQYAKLAGFRHAWQNVRYRGPVAEVARMTRTGPAAPALPGVVLCPAGELDFAQLAAYDARHFGARRDAFLRQWITLPGHQAWAVVSAAPAPAMDLRGFGVIRPCREGWKIGPLFAVDAAVADALLRRLVGGTADGDLITLDTPEANPAAVALAQRYGMTPVFATARMYRNGDPGLPLANVFGITSFELG